LLCLFPREKTDVLAMKNGDRMTCEVKGRDSGVLYVSFDYIHGTTSVQWFRVAHPESNNCEDGGRLGIHGLNTPETPAGQPVKIQVVETQERLPYVVL
jgi:hypothetical protein